MNETIRKEKELITTLRSTPLQERVPLTHKREDELLGCTKGDGGELDRIGTLLCHASSKEMRDEYPIDGDLQDNAQSDFEVEVYGYLSSERGRRTELVPGLYAPAPNPYEGRGSEYDE